MNFNLVLFNTYLKMLPLPGWECSIGSISVFCCWNERFSRPSARACKSGQSHNFEKCSLISWYNKRRFCDQWQIDMDMGALFSTRCTLSHIIYHSLTSWLPHYIHNSAAKPSIVRTYVKAIVVLEKCFHVVIWHVFDFQMHGCTWWWLTDYWPFKQNMFSLLYLQSTV